MIPLFQELVSAKYSEQDARENMYPQLLLYFLRIVSIYDEMMQGMWSRFVLAYANFIGNTVETFSLNLPETEHGKSESQSKEKIKERLGLEIMQGLGNSFGWYAHL